MERELFCFVVFFRIFFLFSFIHAGSSKETDRRQSPFSGMFHMFVFLFLMDNTLVVFRFVSFFSSSSSKHNFNERKKKKKHHETEAEKQKWKKKKKKMRRGLTARL